VASSSLSLLLFSSSALLLLQLLLLLLLLLLVLLLLMMISVIRRCELIALGNGTACRETESYLSDLIQSRWFYPLDVKFTIVNEQGTSIYSCSPVAQKEFPGTDPNVISASNDILY